MLAVEDLVTELAAGCALLAETIILVSLALAVRLTAEEDVRVEGHLALGGYRM
jgi:hypothetical protein